MLTGLLGWLADRKQGRQAGILPDFVPFGLWGNVETEMKNCCLIADMFGRMSNGKLGVVALRIRNTEIITIGKYGPVFGMKREGNRREAYNR